MPLSRQTRVVLGFCPEIFRADRSFLFVSVVAELVNGSWIRLGNPTTSFPPSGTIFVPPELYPNPFRHRDLAAWEVEDQPDFSDSKLGARFRATRSAEGPLEVIPVALLSTSTDVRRHLTEEGIHSVPYRTDKSALLEFQDGRILLAKFGEHALNSHRSVIAAGTFGYPLPAWPPGRPPNTQVLNLDNQSRRIATSHETPTAPEALDLATLEEALTVSRSGGLGATQATQAAKIRRALEQLDETVRSFDGSAWAARRDRLSSFLDQARESADAREKWVAFLAEHSVFRSALDEAVASERERLKASIKQELLAAEPELHERLDQLKQEVHELEEWTSMVREDLKTEENRLSEVVKGIAVHAAIANAEPQTNGVYLPEVSAVANGTLPELATNGKVEQVVLPQPESIVFPDAKLLDSPEQAVQHLEANLIALGVHRVSSKLLAREVLVAASLGQLLLFRGSLADAVAEACATSLIGEQPTRVSVHVGAIATASWNDKLTSGSAGVLIEGFNRSCLSAYGDSIRKILGDRALGKPVGLSPMLLGTILDGPSVLPVSAEMLDYGPLFDTDLLSWKHGENATEAKPGRCLPSAWALNDSPDLDVIWEDVIDKNFPKTCIVWERISRAAINRLGPLLSGVKPKQPHASFAFAWLVPRFVASERTPSSDRLHFPDDLSIKDLIIDDQRLSRLLKSSGLEGIVDAS